MKLSEALEISRAYLYNEYNCCPYYICFAVQDAGRHGKIPAEMVSPLTGRVCDEIFGTSTLAKNLDAKGLFPEAARIEGGYDLAHPEYIKVRDEFLDNLIEKLKKEETEYAFS